MIVESVSIIAIFILMIYFFLRAGKKAYAVAAAPLLVVPLFQVLSKIANEFLSGKINTNGQSLILIIGLALSVALIGVASQLLKNRNSKFIYISICGGFTTVLSIIFLYNNYA